MQSDSAFGRQWSSSANCPLVLGLLSARLSLWRASVALAILAKTGLDCQRLVKIEPLEEREWPREEEELLEVEPKRKVGRKELNERKKLGEKQVEIGRPQTAYWTASGPRHSRSLAAVLARHFRSETTNSTLRNWADFSPARSASSASSRKASLVSLASWPSWAATRNGEEPETSKQASQLWAAAKGRPVQRQDQGKLIDQLWSDQVWLTRPASLAPETVFPGRQLKGRRQGKHTQSIGRRWALMEGPPSQRVWLFSSGQTLFQLKLSSGASLRSTLFRQSTTFGPLFRAACRRHNKRPASSCFESRARRDSLRRCQTCTLAHLHTGANRARPPPTQRPRARECLARECLALSRCSGASLSPADKLEEKLGDKLEEKLDETRRKTRQNGRKIDKFGPN